MTSPRTKCKPETPSACVPQAQYLLFLYYNNNTQGKAMDYRVSEQKTKVTKKSYSILMWDSVVIRSTAVGGHTACPLEDLAPRRACKVIGLGLGTQVSIVGKGLTCKCQGSWFKSRHEPPFPFFFPIQWSYARALYDGL